MKCKLEKLIIEKITSILQIDPLQFSRIDKIELFPKSECEWFNLLDNLIINDLDLDVNAIKVNYSLSRLYKQIMEISPSSFLKEIANKNFINGKYWIDCQNGKIPIYTPSHSEIYNMISQGALIKYKLNLGEFFECNKHTIIGEKKNIFKHFDKNNISNSLKLELVIEGVSYIPFQPAGWFNSALFVNTCKHLENNSIDSSKYSSISKSLRSLKNIKSGIVIAKGFNMKLKIKGEFSKDDLNNYFKGEVFDFLGSYINSSLITKSFDIDKEGGISFTVKTTEEDLLLIGFQLLDIEYLLGNKFITQ